MPNVNSEVIEQIRMLERELARLKQAVFPQAQQRKSADLPFDALVVEVSGFRFALPIGMVTDVVPLVWISPLPHAPAAISGTVNYRGRLTPVLDMHVALSGKPEPLDPAQLMVMISFAERSFALLIDAVHGVFHFTHDDVDTEALLPSLPPFVQLIIRQEQYPVMALDPACLLAAGELNVLDEMLSSVTDVTDTKK